MRIIVAVLFLFLTASIEAKAAVPDREFILISGGPTLHEWERFKANPHDRWWGNFIRSARVRIQELQSRYGRDVKITWLVYRRAYERRGSREDQRDLISLIKSVQEKYGVQLIWFHSTDQLIDYINQGQPRNVCKIASLEYYGHSNRACFLIDYSNEVDSASKVWLHEDDLKRIRRGIFAKNAFVKSWGCHTGESMSKKWKEATGTRMIGAIGKTDYSNGSVPVLSVGARWGG